MTTTVSVYNRSTELDMLSDACDVVHKFLAYEMIRCEGKEGEQDILRACRKAIDAMKSAQLNIKLYEPYKG